MRYTVVLKYQYDPLLDHVKGFITSFFFLLLWLLGVFIYIIYIFTKTE